MISVDSFQSIIGWWPTTRSLAEELGVPDPVVRQWKMKSAIPGRYWQALLETKIARRHGLTAKQLVQLGDYRHRKK